MTKNKKISFVAALLVSLVTVLVSVFSSGKFTTEALSSTDLTKSLTITKVWLDDEAVDRPDLTDLTVHVEKSASTLIPGASLENKMKTLSGSGSTNNNNTTIESIQKATDAEYETIKSNLTSNNEVQSSGEKTYMWFDNSNGTLYFYSEADNIYLNPDSGGTFRKMRQLTDISGLAYFNTAYVTDMNRIFQDSTALADLSPIANWDTGNVTNFRFAFGANTPDAMSYSSLSALSNWNVASAEDMNQMFKGSKYIDTLSGVANWNVQNVKDMEQMFNYAGNISGSLDASGIADWHVENVTTFANILNNTPSNTIKPIFTNRPGSWNGGTYNPSSSAAGTPVPVNTKVRNDNPFMCSSWTDNGDDTWTCTITGIPNDGAIYRAWEYPVHGYQGSAMQSNPAIIGGSDEALTITNSLLNGHSINVKKVTTGAGADQTQDFSFTFNVYDENGVLNSNFTRTVTAKHGQIVHLATIPEDYSYSITEAGTDYTTSYEIADFGDGTVISSGSGTSIGIISPNESQLVTFTNHREDPTKKLITITKTWVDDVPGMRPSDITVTLNKTSSNLISGNTIRFRMVDLAGNASNIYAIKKGSNPPSNAIEIQDSGEKTYMWYDNGTIFVSSEADNIYANEISSNMFSDLPNLVDISWLAEMNTTYVTNMNRMFTRSIKINDLTSLADWDVSNVVDMGEMFASGTNGNDGISMAFSSLEPLANWDTQKVTAMNQMFKGCRNVTTPTPIQDWNVKNVTKMNQMFFRSGLTTTAGLENWQPERVTNFSQMFGNLNDVPTTIALPSFTGRPGTWSSNSGNYSNTTTASGTAPVVTKTPSPDNQTSASGGWVKNDDNTWTYEFSVTDDGSVYTAWESPVPTNYTSTTYDIDHAVAIVNDAATITNTLNTFEVTLKKFITGNMADLNDDFGFDLKVYDSNNQEISDYTKTITLMHGGEAKYKLPQNFKYSIVESDPDATNTDGVEYAEYVEVTKTIGGASVLAKTESRTTNQITLSEDQTVTFTNSKEKAPNTGITDNGGPYSVMIGLVAGSLLAMILVYRLDQYIKKVRDG